MNNSAQLQIAQANARAYYSHRNYYECECRIDPRIEPLDKVWVENVGFVMVEEVEVNFNGGFRGKLKGRIIGENKLLAPVVSSLSWQPDLDPTQFYFRIANNNPFDVTVVIVGSFGERTLSIEAFGSISVTEDDDSRLLDSFSAYARNILEDEVYCYFTDNEGVAIEDSDNTIILEANGR